MAKKEMSLDQKYRSTRARGANPEVEGKAKIRAAEKIAKKSSGYDNDSTIYGLRTKGAEAMGEAYRRKVGGQAQAYKRGGMVKKGKC